MKGEEKLEHLLDSVDLGKPIMNLSVSKSAIRLREPEFTPSFETEGFYEELLLPSVRRFFNGKEFELDKRSILDRVKFQIMDEIKTLFIACSDAKEPTRTKAYKGLVGVIDDNKFKKEFMDSLYDIAEYNYQVTRTESIKSKSNDVHRKNIFQLLSLMEKRYGKAETNSNG